MNVCKSNEEEEQRVLPLASVHEEGARSSTVKKSQSAMSADKRWESQPQLKLKSLTIHDINEPTVVPHASSAFAAVPFKREAQIFHNF